MSIPTKFWTTWSMLGMDVCSAASFLKQTKLFLECCKYSENMNHQFITFQFVIFNNSNYFFTIIYEESCREFNKQLFCSSVIELVTENVLSYFQVKYLENVTNSAQIQMNNLIEVL